MADVKPERGGRHLVRFPRPPAGASELFSKCARYVIRRVSRGEYAATHVLTNTKLHPEFGLSIEGAKKAAFKHAYLNRDPERTA